MRSEAQTVTTKQRKDKLTWRRCVVRAVLAAPAGGASAATSAAAGATDALLQPSHLSAQSRPDKLWFHLQFHEAGIRAIGMHGEHGRRVLAYLVVRAVLAGTAAGALVAAGAMEPLRVALLDRLGS